MRNLYDKNAVPFNLVITTKDMKIRYKKSGALPNSERLRGVVESFLN